MKMRLCWITGARPGIVGSLVVWNPPLPSNSTSELARREARWGRRCVSFLTSLASTRLEQVAIAKPLGHQSKHLLGLRLPRLECEGGVVQGVPLAHAKYQVPETQRRIGSQGDC